MNDEYTQDDIEKLKNSRLFCLIKHDGRYTTTSFCSYYGHDAKVIKTNLTWFEANEMMTVCKILDDET